MPACSKNTIRDLAVFGGAPAFVEPKSTSSLAQPELEDLLMYSRKFFAAEQYSNNGPGVQLLESRLACFHESNYCVAFCSGFWAIVHTIKALALPYRDEIVMPSLTYRRMADIASWCGLVPKFCEVDQESLSLSPTALIQCITDNTALVMAVHPIVNCCDVGGILDVAQTNGLPLIFDSVESVYEFIPAGKIGGFGDAECFSLHASKLINGFEGGYVTTNDKALAEKLRATRTFGFTGHDRVDFEGGMNAKLCEPHAAMALASLDAIENTVSKNRAIYRAYQRGGLGELGLRLVEFNETQKTSFKNIILEVTSEWVTTRDQLIFLLNSEQILARAYYNPPLHRRPMRYPFLPADLPITDSLAERFISMPCGDHVTVADIERIITLLRFISVNGQSILKRLDF